MPPVRTNKWGIRPERLRRLYKRRVPHTASRLVPSLTLENPGVLLLAPGCSHLTVEGDIEERRRVYNHFCTGRGAFSRGPPDGLDEDLVVTDCEALWLLRERLVVVKDKVGGKVYTVPELYTAFQSTNPSFHVVFSAYSHLRRNDWLVRSGVKFGADFNIYTDHPARVHAAFTVVVLRQDPEEWKRLGLAAPAASASAADVDAARDNGAQGEEGDAKETTAEATTTTTTATHVENGNPGGGGGGGESSSAAQPLGTGPAGAGLPTGEASKDRVLNWATLTSWLRVASTTVKDMMICHVVAPASGITSIEEAEAMPVMTVAWSRSSPKVS